jgi:phosphoribosylanthranilate isomerase
VYVKICGITRVEDATWAADVGADAIGLNFIPSSKRCVSVALGRELCAAVHGRVETIAVVADANEDEVRKLVQATGVEGVQLHGDEAPELIERLRPLAYKAVRLRGEVDLPTVESFGGDRILLDAFVPGRLGGTGERVDWALAGRIARSRPVILAGGLTPENVALAVELARPYGVDVASGVEVPKQPGVKDRQSVRAFVEHARRAASLFPAPTGA